MTLLVSACLLGCPCRYDGRSVPCAAVLALMKKHTLIPVCAEQLGGLPTPRIPAERVGDEVIRQDGIPVTEAYRRGAEEVLRLARLYHADGAILKAKSPSCGTDEIYDGSHSRRLVPGMGVTTELLRENGFWVVSENDLDKIS